MRFRAILRFARISVHKVRPVVDMIRGDGVNEALVKLKFTNKRASPMVEKVVKSALASAKNVALEKKMDIDPNSLVVAEAFANEGPTIKRWMTRARGMANKILKRTCHIEVVLESKGEGTAGRS